MEVFLQQGVDAPRTYLEFEISPSPDVQTYSAFIYNPTRTAKGDFAECFIAPDDAGITATTKQYRSQHRWVSTVSLPLGLFNVDNGKAKGTRWRANFFRTIVSPETLGDVSAPYGAWSPTGSNEFHQTDKFGTLVFV